MSTAPRSIDLFQGWENVRTARSRLTQVEVQLAPLEAQSEDALNRWASGMVSGRGGSAMPAWDALSYAQEQVTRCRAAIARRRTDFDLSLANVRAIFAALAGDRLPELLVLNERGPVLYAEAQRTGDWGAYQALRSRGQSLYREVIGN